MSKSYVVTDGDYSDYRIVAVFDDKELASKFVEKYGGSIEEYDVNPARYEIENKYSVFRIEMNKNGDTKEIDSHCDVSNFNRAINKETYNPYYNKNLMLTYVIAKNEKSAVKIANERRIQMIANNEWK
jgi:hypothetical protein